MEDMGTNKPKFEPKMQEPQKASVKKNEDDFKNFFKKDPQALTETFDLALNTAIHIAITRWEKPELLIELLDMLPNQVDRWLALRKGNAHKNTILHRIIHCSNDKMVDTVLDYGKKLTPPEGAENEAPLLELRNDLDETPVYRAAKYGKLKILKKMAEHVSDMGRHFHRKDKTSILHIAIIGQHFHVALWLLNQKVSGIEGLIQETDENGLTCLQLLSRMPSVFRSHISHMQFFKWLIYLIIPDQDDGDCDESKLQSQGTDPESGKNREDSASVSRINNATWKFIAGVLSRINCAIWRFLAEEYDEIGHIWETKEKHRLAEKLADSFVDGDNSWHNTNNALPRKEVVLPAIQPTNIVAQGKSKIEKSRSMEHFTKLEKSQSIQFTDNAAEMKYKLKGSQSIEQPIESSKYTPLLLAASTGIVEIVEKIIEKYPVAITHVSVDDGQNILHVAVKHRQKRVYETLKKYGALRRLASQMSNKNRTLLHQVARMDYYNGGNKAGAVFQLQDELRWFKKVKKVVPTSFMLYCDDNKQTAEELFAIEHANMLKDAQDWIKGTAQSCSAVAVLVATVVFAGAYTIPGGTNDDGTPKFINSSLFLFFINMDIVALASSLVAVMTFLSILTSPFEMKDFHKSLPSKLTLGFTCLVFSLMTTMLAFGSTILLTIPLEKNKWTSILIYATFFPVTLFGLKQFPICMAVKNGLKRLWKACKKIFPRRFTKSTKGIEEKSCPKQSRSCYLSS